MAKKKKKSVLDFRGTTPFKTGVFAGALTSAGTSVTFQRTAKGLVPKISKPKGKIATGFRVAGGVLGLTATIGSLQRSLAKKGTSGKLKEILGSEVVKAAGSVVGGAAIGVAGILAAKRLKALRAASGAFGRKKAQKRAAKAAKAAAAVKTGTVLSKSGRKKGKFTFRRIRGRIVPIALKG